MANSILWLPPTVRFIVEATTWIYLLIYNWYILPLSLISLAIFNFPGDKSPEGQSIGFNVPGIVRILVEFGSAALGIFAAYQISPQLAFYIQLILTILMIILDWHRYMWMLGKAEVPRYVTFFQKTK